MGTVTYGSARAGGAISPVTSGYSTEHRMFSAITMKRRGRPMETHETDRRPDHRRDHGQNRPHDPGHARHRHLPEWHQEHRPAHSERPPEQESPEPLTYAS